MSQLTLYNASSPSPTLGLRLWMTCLPQPRRRQEPQPESLQYGGPPSQSLTAVQTLGGLAAPAPFRTDPFDYLTTGFASASDSRGVSARFA